MEMQEVMQIIRRADNSTFEEDHSVNEFLALVKLVDVQPNNMSTAQWLDEVQSMELENDYAVGDEVVSMSERDVEPASDDVQAYDALLEFNDVRFYPIDAQIWTNTKTGKHYVLQDEY